MGTRHIRALIIVLVCVIVVQLSLLVWLGTRPRAGGRGSEDGDVILVSALGFPERDRTDTWRFIRNRPWEDDRTPYVPSEALQQHASRFGTPHEHSLPWLFHARKAHEAGRVKEAAERIIDGVMEDRTFLAYLIDAIDEVAFPLITPLVESGDRDTALRLISACAVASADPIAYMRFFLARMPQEGIDALWNDDPYVTLADFQSETLLEGMHMAIDFQERERLEWAIDPGTGYKGESSVLITAGEPSRDGIAIVGWREARMDLSSGVAGLRVYVRTEEPEPVELVLRASGRFGNGRHFDSVLRVPVPTPLDDGWLRFDTADVGPNLFDAAINEYGWTNPWFMEDLQIHDIENAEVTLSAVGLDLPPESRNRYWIDRVEAYFPEGSWEREPPVPEPSGFGLAWRPTDQDQPDEDATEEELEQFAQLEALGYLGAVTMAPETDGVTIHDTRSAYPGLNFYVTGPSPELYLMDMDGAILHTWRPRLDDPAWPEEEYSMSARENMSYRRAHLFPNGDVLAIQEGRTLLKMDKDSHIIWVKTGGYHHDLRVMEDETIYVLYREWEALPTAGPGNKTLVDYIMLLDADGNELRRVSLIKALEDSPYAPLLDWLHYPGDMLHTNSIQVLDGQLSDRIPAFREGNVLVCILRANLIALVDLDKEEVVWGLTGKWLNPHDPKLLPNDTMLIFDNMGPSWHELMPPASRVMEFDPITREVVWEYVGSRDQPFYSNVCGASWRLPNDNILITETTNGRVFEVTRDKEIVWEYINPDRDGEEEELIGVINELIRYPADYADAWLE